MKTSLCLENSETVCEGGVVDDVYLEVLAGCKVIEGDLIFENIYSEFLIEEKMVSVTEQ